MPELPPLEEECPDCHGEGRVGVLVGPERWSTGSPCERCGETGRAPTEAGAAILALLKGRRLGHR